MRSAKQIITTLALSCLLLAGCNQKPPAVAQPTAPVVTNNSGPVSVQVGGSHISGGTKSGYRVVLQVQGQ